MKPNSPKWKNAKLEKRLSFTEQTQDESILFDIAMTDVSEEVALAAINKISDQELLKSLFLLPVDSDRAGCLIKPVISCPYYDNYETVRIAVIQKITDPEFLSSANREALTLHWADDRSGGTYGLHILDAIDSRLAELV